MRKVAEKIVVREEIKTDFIYDMEGRQTDMTYDYKEYDILDKDDNLIETNRSTDLDANSEEIRKSLGIKFGVSTWITND
jgi:hypothetical protein